MSGSNYLLDANVFITAKNDYYSFGVCPGFWKFLEQMHKSKRVFSIDKIHDELKKEQDKLLDWAMRVPDSFYKKTQDQAVAEKFGQLVGWVTGQPFLPGAKAEFASSADGWLIAYASVNSLKVVTLETHEPDRRNKVKIPNVCLEFDVDYCNTFEMLKELKAKFVNSPRR